MRKNIGVFRGKRKDNGEWVEGFFTCATDCCGRSYFIDVPRKDPDDSNHRYEVDSETVCEFTGLTDKNGVKFFEGDIIKYETPGYDDVVYGTINFGEYAIYNIGFYISWLNNLFIRQDLGFWLKQREIVIIGNIYDNPELLGGTK